MNVNVTYSGYTLADAASCVMMRLPVPDLVWDMEALWKVWNEPIPAITPEAVPEPTPEPVRRRGGERFAAKPVTYAGKEYPSIAALAKAYGLGYKTCFARLRDGLPLEAPINTHPLPYRGKPVTIDGKEYCSVKDASKALGIPYTTLITRIRKGQDLSAPKYADRCEPIVYRGKEYPSARGCTASGTISRLTRRGARAATSRRSLPLLSRKLPSLLRSRSPLQTRKSSGLRPAAGALLQACRSRSLRSWRVTLPACAR